VKKEPEDEDLKTEKRLNNPILTLMTKYETLITKIHLQEVDPSYDCNFSEAELTLIAEALETIQFLEIVFALRLRNLKQENYE